MKGKKVKDMTTQYMSSKELFQKGTTLLNCKPSIEEVLKDIAKWLEMNSYISFETRTNINKNARSRQGFQLVWEHLQYCVDDINSGKYRIPTKQGDIFRIGVGGVSKVRLAGAP
jgi:hypothetical protein